MKKRWDSLIKRSQDFLNILIDSERADIIFEYCIKVSYSKNRYYHTLKHINSVLNAIQDFKLSPEERVKIEWAIWFHDYIYDVKSTNNEQKSAEQFKIITGYIRMEKEVIEEIAKLIIITKHDKEPETKLEKIICDGDLKELASLNHLKNVKNIRLEYSFLNDEEWKKGRKEFLEFMLNKKYIFHTNEYRNLYKKQARDNLQLELNNI